MSKKQQQDSGQDVKNVAVKSALYVSGLKAFSQSPLRLTYRSVKDSLKYEVKEDEITCPACCKDTLQETYSDKGGLFVGWSCDNCGLLVKSKDEDISILHEFIRNNARNLYLKHGGIEAHLNDITKINRYYLVSQISLIAAVCFLFGMLYSISKGGLLTPLLLLAFTLYMVFSSIKAAFQGYIISEGLMYTNMKENFKGWISEYNFKYWQNPITEEIKELENE